MRWAARALAGVLVVLALVALAPAEVSAQLRVIAHAGKVTGLGSDDASGSDRLVTLAPGATLELALADHARLSVRGPATLMLAPAGAPALLLRTGVLTVDCAAPVLPDAAPALWVATGAVRLEVAQRARFVLRARPDGSLLSLVSGAVRVRHDGTTDDLAEDGTSCFHVGQRTAHAPLQGKLEARSAALASAAPCVRVAEPSDAKLAQQLREELASLQDEQAHGRALLASHQALGQSDPGAAAETQAEIARRAALRMRLSELVRARRSVLAARTLGSASPALRDLLARAREAAP